MYRRVKQLGSAPGWRGYARLFLVVAILQLGFTSVVRLIVVPVLTPSNHWAHGLPLSGDSQFFQEYALTVLDGIRDDGLTTLDDSRYQGLLHAKLIAVLYLLAGSSNPWVVFLVNVVLSGFTACLLRVVLLRAGADLVRSWWLSVLLCASPLLLFSYSELLREPFIVPAVLLYVIGTMMLLTPVPRAAWPELLVGLSLTIGGYWLSSSFRPYLLLPMFGAALVAIVVRWARPAGLESAAACHWRQWVASAAAVAVMGGLLTVSSSRVQKYQRQGVSPSASERPSMTRRPRIPGRTRLSREMVSTPSWCGVAWRRSEWLPAALDRKVESLACARHDFLRFCDLLIWGDGADRNCDDTQIASAAEMALHIPRALSFGLLSPDPRMWFSGFGSGGTGLRRAGYVVDGVLAYALLVGLAIGLAGKWRSRPDLAGLTAGLLTVLTIYALAVPSQFLLSRMRLGFYIVLLGLGAVAIGDRIDRGRRQV